jgi:hypothetical protein
MSCPYADIAGKPGTSYHSIRFLNLSVVDIIGTFFLFAIPTAWIFKGNVWVHFTIWLVVGEIFHYGFGVQTSVMDMLGITACSRRS